MSDADTSPPHGLPCWNEVTSDDLPATRLFYRRLLDWEAADQDMGPGGFYTLFRHAGRDVAGGLPPRPEQRAAGLVPRWLPYFAVADAHQAAARLEPQGGQTLVPPTEVPGMGRFVVAAAPGGALLGLWQDLTGAPWPDPPQAPGLPCWVELRTRDPQGAEAFYRELLGWRAGEREYGGRSYTVLFLGTRPVASLETTPLEPDAADSWLPYFAVADAQAALGTVEEAGGSVVRGPYTLPGLGRYAVVRDPRGALFGVKELE